MPGSPLTAVTAKRFVSSNSIRISPWASMSTTPSSFCQQWLTNNKRRYSDLHPKQFFRHWIVTKFTLLEWDGREFWSLAFRFDFRYLERNERPFGRNTLTSKLVNVPQQRLCIGTYTTIWLNQILGCRVD